MVGEGLRFDSVTGLQVNALFRTSLFKIKRLNFKIKRLTRR